MISIGIDNSYTGAIAAVEFLEAQNPRVISCELMPTISVGKSIAIDEDKVWQRLIEIRELYEDVIIGFEIGQKNPLFGCKGNFSNGFSYGVIRTVVRLSGMRHIEINPKTWQKEIFRDIRGLEMSTKSASIEYCRRQFPEQSLLPTPRCKKPHDGMADSLCLAVYTAKE